jgi:Tol biopolymer transport system component
LLSLLLLLVLIGQTAGSAGAQSSVSDGEEVSGGTALQQTQETWHIVSTITGYEAPDVIGYATYASRNVSIPAGSSITYRYPAATELSFNAYGTCNKVADTQIRCESDTTRLYVFQRYRFNVTATTSGFVHAISSRSSNPMDLTVELNYPWAYTYVSADDPPETHTDHTLTWTKSGVTSFAANVTFDTGKDLTIQSMTPDEGFNDQETSVTISGNGFATASAPSARLVGAPGSYDLTVTSANSTELAATVPAGMPVGSYDLIVTNPDGGTGTALDAFTVVNRTSNTAAGRIFFTSDRPGNYDVFAMNGDGSNPSNLTDHPATDWYPNGSWDGTQVAFASKRNGEQEEIYLMDADGSDQTRLTDNAFTNVQPVLSPDGTRIVFTAKRNDRNDLYVMNADGTGVTQITTDPGNEHKPAWSPDGTRIAFAYVRNPQPGEAWAADIYTMKADGTDRQRLTFDDQIIDTSPVWSPDGTQIAFRSMRDANAEVYVMDADGSNPTRLTDHPAWDGQPTWSPDGTQIAFSTTRDGNWEIYVMNADGSNPVNITNSPAEDTYPSWTTGARAVCTEQVDLMLVLDGSSSINASDFTRMQDFARNLVNSFAVGPNDAQIGIVQFASQGKGGREIGLSADPGEIITRVDGMQQLKGSTDLEEGLRLARAELTSNGRAGVPQVIILLADGEHNQGGDPLDEAQQAKTAQMHLFAVAVGGNLNMNQLRAIASDPDAEYVFAVKDFADLESILGNLVATTCPLPPEAPTPPEQPTPTPQPTTLDVRAIEPNEGYNDAATGVTILGSAFATTPAPSARLRGNAGTFEFDGETAADAGRLEATVPAGLPAGTYDLVITNPNGKSATLPRAFTVLARDPALTQVIPNTGLNDQDTAITLFGQNFADGVKLDLGNTRLATTRVNGTTLQAVVPAGLSSGSYDLTATNPDNAQATLIDAYTVLDDSSNNDLTGYSHELWVNPVVPRVGTTTQIGVFVHRLGGKRALQDVTVEFRRDAVTGPVLGRSTVPFLDPPDSVDSTIPLEVSFDQTETFDLYAIIDPDDNVPEDIDTNNVVSRTVTVAAATSDRKVPEVRSITVNGTRGATVDVPNATVEIDAIDPQPNPSGVQSIHIIEYVYNEGAEQWVPVVQSGWLAYDALPDSYRWSLVPQAGMHYLQVRAVDKAGNVSIGRSQQLANYTPATEQVRRRESHIYRYNVAAGEQLTVDLEVLSGDADLYVWSSRDDQSAGVSNLEGNSNEQVTTPVADSALVYQVEVYGYTSAEYRLTAQVGPAQAQLQATPAVGGVSSTKDQPDAPVVSVSSVPDERQGSVPAPEIADTPSGSSIYLPLVVR